MQIYELYYSWYEEYSPVLFTAPRELTKEEWVALCDSLLESAVKSAIEKDIADKRESWIGWPDIVNAMCELLEKQNFQRVQPIKHGYFGSSIIRDEKGHEEENSLLSPESLKLLDEHNQRIEKKLDEWHDSRVEPDEK